MKKISYTHITQVGLEYVRNAVVNDRDVTSSSVMSIEPGSLDSRYIINMFDREENKRFLAILTESEFVWMQLLARSKVNSRKLNLRSRL